MDLERIIETVAALPGEALIAVGGTALMIYIASLVRDYQVIDRTEFDPKELGVDTGADDDETESEERPARVSISQAVSSTDTSYTLGVVSEVYATPHGYSGVLTDGSTSALFYVHEEDTSEEADLILPVLLNDAKKKGGPCEFAVEFDEDAGMLRVVGLRYVLAGKTYSLGDLSEEDFEE